MLLAIETSCDETAIAILDRAKISSSSKGLLADALLVDEISSQIELHTAYGGVVPELAAREHLNNLPLMVDNAFKTLGISADDIDSIAVTQGPGLKGCLLVGICFAKAFALARRIPLVAVNHMEGHLFAGDLLPKSEQAEFPMIALIVSGGHTQLVYVESFRQYKLLANTRDDAAGEAFDKAATLLGLPYPGGPALAKVAESGDASRFDLPVALRQDPSSFSFSGLKTALARTIQKLDEEARGSQCIADLAASLQKAIVTALIEKTIVACKTYEPKSVVLTGGVAANVALRISLAGELSKLGIGFSVPARKWCTDNAAMIAAVACRQLEHGLIVNSVEEYQFPAKPRWPLLELTQLDLLR